MSSKFTSMVNAADKLGGQIEKAKISQMRNKEDRAKAASATSYSISRKSVKAKRMVSVSQTIEFVETRAAKVAGKRAPFEAWVLTDHKQE